MLLKFLIILSLVSFTSAFNYFKGARCLLHNGKCIVACPKGMHPYHTVCSRDTMSQRTCEQPYIVNIGYTCGWSRCDCNGDRVFNEKVGLCVDIDLCPRGAKRTGGKRKNKKKAFPLPKKVIVNDGDENFK